MYFEFSTFFKVVRLMATRKPNLRQMVIHVGILACLSLWAGFNAVCLQLDRLLFPGYKKARLDRPLFIIGNPRSGTTFFYQLLCEDTQRFVHFRLWEILFPSLLQKKCLRALATFFKKRFPRSFQRIVQWEKQRFQTFKQIHPFGVNQPEEDELLLLMTFSTIFIRDLFPYLSDLHYLAHFDQRPAPLRQKVMRFYQACLLRQLYFHGGRRTLLSKNVAFTSKIRTLAHTFPTAQFIYLIRSPYETIPSLLMLKHNIWKRLGISGELIEQASAEVVKDCLDKYPYALRALREMPEQRYAVITYRDLIADPKAAVEQAYGRLGLSISPAFASRLDARIEQAQRSHVANVYTLEEFNTSAEEIAEALGDIMVQFDFDSKPPIRTKQRG